MEKLTISFDDFERHPDLLSLLDLLLSEVMKRGVDARIAYHGHEFVLRLNRTDAANDPVYLLIDRKKPV